MNEKLSALMDGELDRDAAAIAIKALGSNDAQRQDWDCYHLIGDALRGLERTQDGRLNVLEQDANSMVRRQASADVIFAQLAAEPTVLAPASIPQSRASAKPTPVQQRTRFALAMAASVVTVSAIGVVAFKQQQGSPAALPQVAQQTSSLPISSTSAGASPTTTTALAGPEARVNDYLLIHRQFANPAALQAAVLKRNERSEQRQATGQ